MHGKSYIPPMVSGILYTFLMGHIQLVGLQEKCYLPLEAANQTEFNGAY